jgi:hypothetical protein
VVLEVVAEVAVAVPERGEGVLCPEDLWILLQVSEMYHD